MPKIIVLQTSSAGRDTCQKALIAMGLKSGEDFVLLDDFRDIEKHVVPHERQLLITGSFHQNPQVEKGILKQVRSKSQQLVCASYSSIPLECPLDFVIKKFTFGALEAAVRLFLDGTLDRSIKVILFQHLVEDGKRCLDAFVAAGWNENTNFHLVLIPQNVECFLKPGVRQCLILGESPDFTAGRIAELTSKLREQYPLLVCVSYNEVPLFAHFDYVVNKDSGSHDDELGDFIQKLRAGEVERVSAPVAA